MPGGTKNNKFFGAAAVTVRAAAGSSAVGAPMMPMRERRQIVHALAGFDDHAAAIAAVTAVGAAMGHEFLAAKAEAAVASFAGLDLNFDPINEHGNGPSAPTTLALRGSPLRPSHGCSAYPKLLAAQVLKRPRAWPKKTGRSTVDRPRRFSRSPLSAGRSQSVLCSAPDAHPAPAAIERDDAVDQCEQRVVLPLADSAARRVTAADLANQDVAGNDLFTAVPLMPRR